MPNHRLIPLLIAGAACLPLAACGSDDEPAATATQSNVPAATAPSDATAEAPATDTTEAPATGDGQAADSPAADAPTSDAKPADSSTKGTGDSSGSADDSGSAAKKDGTKDSSSSSSSAKKSSGSSSSKPKGKQPEAPKVPKVLEEYAKGGAPATPDQAAAVRDTMLGFQDALVAQDAAKACSYTLGLPAKSDPSKPSPSCEALIEGSKMAPPTDQDRELIRTAKITVEGDRASIEMGGSGMPMPFRNVDGRWRIDYGTLLGLGGSAG